MDKYKLIKLLIIVLFAVFVFYYFHIEEAKDILIDLIINYIYDQLIKKE